MKKLVCVMLAGALLMAFAGCALAEREVKLPESSYHITLPDGMEYDGPGKQPDDAKFAWVSEKIGLDIEFFCAKNDRGATLEAMATVLYEDDTGAYDSIENIEIRRIAGIDMIRFEMTDPGDDPAQPMKGVTYIFLDGKTAQQISFWYANQEAADLTATIIESISKD